MQTITLSKIKNRYIYPLMKVVKNKRPYYAQWWFFISLLTLGWLTPITKHWKLYFWGETTTAYSVLQLNQFNFYEYYFLYSVDGSNYYVDYDFDLGEKPNPKGIKIIYDPNDPSNCLAFQLSKMYSDENLFFPLGFQIAFGVFFLSIRFKDL